MASPPQIDTHAQVTFDTNIAFQAQQMNSILRDTVDEEILDGEKRFFDDYGEASMVERLARGQANTPQELARARRMITPRDFEYTEEFDEQKDDIRLRHSMRTDGKFAKAIMASVMRQIDDLIIEAYDATALTGKDGTTSTVFDTAQDIAIGVGAGNQMNTTKARAARALLKTADVAQENPWFMVLRPDAVDQMLGETESTSSDFNIVKALVEGEIDRWLGFQWRQTTRIAAITGTEYYAFAYAMDAMIFAMNPGSIITEWEKLPGRGRTWQYAVYGTMSSTRRFENKIVRIRNDEALDVDT